MEWKVKRFDELSANELYDILQLRTEVFVVEQTCVYQDLDGKDQNSIHVWGSSTGELIAYARIVNPGVSYKEVSIGRVVVSAKHRGEELGKELMLKTIEIVQQQFGKQAIRISAQSHLEKFYTELGFKHTGKSYLEDGIPHIEMLRNLR